jgi:hypothetical protein
MSEYEAAVEWHWQGKTEGIGEKAVTEPRHFFSGASRPATNRLSYDATQAAMLLRWRCSGEHSLPWCDKAYNSKLKVAKYDKHTWVLTWVLTF